MEIEYKKLRKIKRTTGTWKIKYTQTIITTNHRNTSKSLIYTHLLLNNTYTNTKIQHPK